MHKFNTFGNKPFLKPYLEGKDSNMEDTLQSLNTSLEDIKFKHNIMYVFMKSLDIIGHIISSMTFCYLHTCLLTPFLYWFMDIHVFCTHICPQNLVCFFCFFFIYLINKRVRATQAKLGECDMEMHCVWYRTWEVHFWN